MRPEKYHCHPDINNVSNSLKRSPDQPSHVPYVSRFSPSHCYVDKFDRDTRISLHLLEQDLRPNRNAANRGGKGGYQKHPYFFPRIGCLWKSCHACMDPGDSLHSKQLCRRLSSCKLSVIVTAGRHRDCFRMLYNQATLLDRVSSAAESVY
jgi:hypothetical protein